MGVNSYLIYEKLNNIIDKKLHACTLNCNIKYVTIYNTQISLKDDAVYIVIDKDNFPENKEDSRHKKCLFVVMGLLDENIKNKTDYEYIAVSEDIGVGKLYESLYDIIDQYNKWEEAMAQALLKGSALNKICNLAVKFFGNPLTVQDDCFKLIGIGETKEISYPYEFREGDSEYLSEIWVQSAMRAEDYVFSKREPFEFNYIQEHSSLLYNIIEDNVFRAQICVDANHRKIVVQDYIRICILSKYVRQYVVNLPRQNTCMQNDLRALLYAYIDGKKSYKEGIESIIERRGWNVNDNYICIAIEKRNNNMDEMNSDFFCSKWEMSFLESVCISNNGYYYIMENITKLEKRNISFDELIGNISSQYSVIMGLSEIFEGFLSFSMYLKQASGAIKIGIRYDKEKRVYKFDEYKLKYIVKYGVSSLPIKTLIPKSLTALIDYDKDNNTDFCKTLICYLKNSMSISDTATQLFIGRSTLKYRIQRIREIMDTDLSDHDEQLYMELILFELGEMI